MVQVEDGQDLFLRPIGIKIRLKMHSVPGVEIMVVLDQAVVVDKGDLLFLTDLADCLAVFGDLSPDGYAGDCFVGRGYDRVDKDPGFRQLLPELFEPLTEVLCVLLRGRPEPDPYIVDAIADKNIVGIHLLEGIHMLGDPQDGISGLSQDPLRGEKAEYIVADYAGVTQEDIVLEFVPDIPVPEFVPVFLPLLHIGELLLLIFVIHSGLVDHILDFDRLPPVQGIEIFLSLFQFSLLWCRGNSSRSRRAGGSGQASCLPAKVSLPGASDRITSGGSPCPGAGIRRSGYNCLNLSALSAGRQLRSCSRCPAASLVSRSLRSGPGRF